MAELAAGTGQLTSQLAQRCPKTRILAHDRQPFPLWRCDDPIPANITHWPGTSFEDLVSKLRAGRRLGTFDRVYCILPESLPKPETRYASTALELVAPQGEIHMILDDHGFAHEVAMILRKGDLVVQTAEVPTFLRSRLSAIVERDLFDLLDPNVPLIWVAAKRRAPRHWDLPPLLKWEDLVVPTNVMEKGRLITSRAKGPLSAADSLVIDMEMLCWGRPMSDRLLWGGLRVGTAGYRVDHVDLSRMADGGRRFLGKFVTDSGSVVGEFEYIIPPPPGIDQVWLARQQRMQLAPNHQGRGIEQSFLENWSRFLHHLGVDGILSVLAGRVAPL